MNHDMIWLIIPPKCRSLQLSHSREPSPMAPRVLPVDGNLDGNDDDDLYVNDDDLDVNDDDLDVNDDDLDVNDDDL